MILRVHNKLIPYVRFGDLVIRPLGLAVVIETGSQQDRYLNYRAFDAMYFWTNRGQGVVNQKIHAFTRSSISSIYTKSVVR